MTFRLMRGREAGEHRAEGLLRGVFSGESGIALAHAADGRVQHGEKQENEDAVGNAAGKLRPRLKQFKEEWVGRRISIQRLEVQQEIADCREGREMRT
jgi:hypothetical protein